MRLPRFISNIKSAWALNTENTVCQYLFQLVHQYPSTSVRTFVSKQICLYHTVNTRLTAIGLVKMKCIAKEMCRKENKLRHRDLVNKVFFSRLFFQWMNQESMNHVFAMSLKQESRPSGIETTTNL